MFRHSLYAGNNKYSVALCAVFIIIGVILYQNHFLLWAEILAGLALLAFGTRRLRWIDPTRAVVKDEWRFYLFLPLFTLSRHLVSYFERLELRLEYRKTSGSKSSLEYFVLDLKPAQGDRLRVKEFRNYLKARRLAERIASTVRLPLHDKTFGSRQVRRWDELNLSLRERLRNSGVKSARPVLPADSRIVEQDRGEAIHLRMTPDATSIPLILMALLLTQIFTLIGWVMWEFGPGLTGLVIMAIGIVSGVFFTETGLASRRLIEVTITADKIDIRQGWHRKQIQTKALEEMVFGRKNIYFLGDKMAYPFPFDFFTKEQKAEAAYLLAMVQYVLAR